MTDEELWRMEEAFWTGGGEHYRRALDPLCRWCSRGSARLDAKPAVEALKSAPRWCTLGIEERRVTRPAGGIATLAYRARAIRDGAAAYEAWCSSSYRRDADRWLLFQHQQTPI